MSDQDIIAKAVKDLSGTDDRILRARLGAYSMQFPQAPDKFAAPDALVPGAEATAGPMMDAAIALGTRIVNRWNKVLYDLACGGTDVDEKVRASILDAVKLKSPDAIAAAITAALISVFSVGPAIATIVGVLLGKLLLPAAGKEVCAFWKEKLPA
jgi:hypothetical protein